jgi:hypothetical protein
MLFLVIVGVRASLCASRLILWGPEINDQLSLQLNQKNKQKISNYHKHALNFNFITAIPMTTNKNIKFRFKIDSLNREFPHVFPFFFSFDFQGYL